MKSCVIVIPAAQVDAMNALGHALGWGPKNCSVPLYTGEVITHYAGRADASSAFESIISNAQQGVLPDGLDADPQQVQGLLSLAVIDIAEPGVHESPRAHFESVITEMGLSDAAPTD